MFGSLFVLDDPFKPEIPASPIEKKDYGLKYTGVVIKVYGLFGPYCLSGNIVVPAGMTLQQYMTANNAVFMTQPFMCEAATADDQTDLS